MRDRSTAFAARRAGFVEFLACLSHAANGSAVVRAAFVADALLDPQALRRSLEAEIARQPMLRTFIERRQRAFWLILHDPAAVDLADCLVVDATAQWRSIDDFIERWARPGCLEAGPPFRVGLFPFPALGRSAIVLVCHHAVGDGISANATLENIVNRALGLAVPDTDPPARSLPDSIERIRGGDAGPMGFLRFAWRDLRNRTRACPIAHRSDARQRPLGGRTVFLVVGNEESRRLRAEAQRERVNAGAILAAAAIFALAKVCRSRSGASGGPLRGKIPVSSVFNHRYDRDNRIKLPRDLLHDAISIRADVFDGDLDRLGLIRAYHRWHEEQSRKPAGRDNFVVYPSGLVDALFRRSNVRASRFDRGILFSYMGTVRTFETNGVTVVGAGGNALQDGDHFMNVVALKFPRTFFLVVSFSERHACEADVTTFLDGLCEFLGLEAPLLCTSYGDMVRAFVEDERADPDGGVGRRISGSGNGPARQHGGIVSPTAIAGD